MNGNDSKISCRPLVLLAIVLAAAMFIFPLSIHFPLLDPDEGLHASIAQEMVERGDWITPHFLGKPFLDKPIFYFWAQAIALRVLGPSEAAVRLPGLMFGLLGAMTTVLLAWRMFGRATGLIAGILYATMILPTALAQAASHDVALVPWINLTLLLLWELDCAAGCGKGKLAAVACVAGAGFFLGLSILTKGLTGVAVVGLAYGGYVLCRWLSTRMPSDDTGPKRKRSSNVRPRLRVGLVCAGVLLIAVGVATPWYLAVEARNPHFVRAYLLNRHLLGFATDTQPHGDQPWWYYLPVLLGGGLPWIGYIAWGSRGEGRGTRDEPKLESPTFIIHHSSFIIPPIPRPPSPVPLLWCWLIGWTLFLTAAQSKLATYLWPAFPPIAILAAVAWTRLIEGTLTDAARRSFGWTFIWSSWSGPIVLPAALWGMQWVYAMHFAWPVWVAVGLVAAMTPLPLIAWRAGRWQASLSAAALSLATQFVVVMAMVLPPTANMFSARDLAEHFNHLGHVPPRLFVAGERIGSLVFYLAPPLRAGLKAGQLQRLFRDRPPQWQPGDVVVVPEQELWRLNKYFDVGVKSYESVGRFRLYRITSTAKALRSD